MMIVSGEHRLCPDCGHALSFFKNRYLCRYCWRFVSYVDSLPNTANLCNFTESVCGAGIWLSCVDCGKYVLLRQEEVDRIEKEHDDAYVALMRRAVEERDARINREIQELRENHERSEAMRKVFEQVYGAGGMENVKVVESV